MGASVGKAIDYLVAGLAGPVAAFDKNGQVWDTHPRLLSNTWIIVGRSDPDDEETGSASSEYQELGAGRISEDYTLDGVAHAERPGPDPKPARDAAVALLDVVVKFVHADPTLGGLLQKGRIGLVSRYSLRQADSASDSAEMVAEVRFTLDIHNTYIP